MSLFFFSFSLYMNIWFSSNGYGNAMAFPSSIFLLLLLFPIFTSSQNIPVGTSLTAAQSSNPWRSSPNGDFAFGFQQLQNSSDQFILSIWFDKIPNKTIVWYERTSYPVPRGSTLRLDASDGLLLHDPQGSLLYSTSTGGGAANRVGYASMNDTGNLVIFGSEDSSVLWESFRHPTDTILPTQTLEINEILISRRTETDFSKGRFFAFIGNSGNFVFITYDYDGVPSNSDYNNNDEYYSSSLTSSDNASDAGVRVAFSGGALISVVRRNGSEQSIGPRSVPSPSDNYYRAILEFDGVFRLYYHPKNNSGDNPTWQVAGYWPANICMQILKQKGRGACGYNSVCRIENQRPVCECPKGFSLTDPTNPSGDCKANSGQSCISGENGDEYELEVITDADWPLNDYDDINPSSEDLCRSSCLNDCLCGVAIYRSNSCWKKKLPLSNGRVDTTLGVKAFLRLRKSDLNPNPARNDSTTQNGNGSENGLSDVQKYAIIGVSICVVISIICYFSIPHILAYLEKRSNPDLEQFLLTHGSLAQKRYSFYQIKKMTKSFKDKLGQGGFGIVYKGELPDGQPVAVKVLTQVHDDAQEFINEVASISRTSHVNVVNLLGFCYGRKKRALVYEFMPNKSLDKFIRTSGSIDPECSLESDKLFGVAVGVARGLEYLHRGCNTRIVHFDIKPQNILLDGDFCPKISDFGLAKLFKNKQSIISMLGMRGTVGYIAPEVFSRNFGVVSHKSDVYSYGMTILEMTEARKMVEMGPIQSSENYIHDNIYEILLLKNEKMDDVMRDEREEGEMKMLMVGLWCIQTAPMDRPSMSKVVEMLEGSVQSIQIPPKPLFPSLSRSLPLSSSLNMDTDNSY